MFEQSPPDFLKNDSVLNGPFICVSRELVIHALLFGQGIGGWGVDWLVG